MKQVVINGRFLTQATTGVQRVAEELVRALDRELEASPALRQRYSFRLAVPPGERRGLELSQIRTQEVGRLRGQGWEQLELPGYSRGGLLLNLCNTAPVRVRSVVVIHDASVFAVPQAYSPAFRAWYRMLLPLVGRRALQVITVSRFSQNELAHRAGIPLAKVQVLPLGADHVLRVPADREIFRRVPVEPLRYILAVGSRSPHKNLDALKAAVTNLGPERLPLVLAGGTNARVFAARAPSEGNYDAGYVTDGELRALYEGAACFVYPSLYEGFGLPPLEAMMCGCPALVSKAGSLPEVCNGGAALCDPRDTEDITRSIRQLIAQPGARERLVRAGSEHARRFTWEGSARTLLSILERDQPA